MAYILDQFSLFATACFVKCVDLKKKKKTTSIMYDIKYQKCSVNFCATLKCLLFLFLKGTCYSGR